MTKSKTLLLLVAVIAVTVVLLQSSSLLSLDSLKQYSEQLQSFYHASPLTTTVVFFSVYVLAVALSIPAASLLTLLAGFLFPFLVGLAVVSFASTIGCSLAFLFSRYFFRDWIQQRFKQSYERIDREFEKQGTEYLLALRLVPLFPFFVINAVMGLTRISLPRYFIVSQLGMLPGTAVYVYAGQQLGNIRSMSDILTPGLWFSFLLLGMLPLLSRKLLAVYRNHRILSVFKRPAGFDYQVAVIGAGAAGLVAANIASKLKATVLLVEQDKMGGDCLNTGCVPSKVLLKVAHDVSLARQYGADQPVDINSLKAAINKAIKTIEPHDSVERYTSLGVDCEKGKALVTSPWELEIAGKKTSAKRIVIATGAKPAIPDIPGLQQVPYLTSETIWSIDRLPGRMVVIGGGAMGCEMAQAFSLLGVEVTLLQRNQYLLPSEDPVFSKMIQQSLEQQGVNIICSVSDLFMEVKDGQAFAHFTESTGGIGRKLPLGHL